MSIGELGAVVAGCLSVALLVIGLHVAAYSQLSPIDELQHFDYMLKASEGHVVRLGERVGQQAMRTEACRGIDAPGFGTPPCDAASFVPDDFQEYGYNTAASQSPIYYVVSGLVARATAAVGPVDDLFVTGRMAGAVWLAAGLVVTWLLGRTLGISRWGVVVALGLTATTPVVLHASATINPDGSLLAAGATLTLAVLLWEGGHVPLLATSIVTVIAAAIEPTVLLALGTLALYLGLRATTDAASRRRLLLAAALILGIGVAVSAAGIAYRQSVALPAADARLPRDDLFEIASLPLDRVTGELGSLVTPLHNPYVAPPLRGVGTSVATSLGDWLVLGAAIGATLWGGTDRRLRALAGAAVLTMLLAGPALVLYNFYGSGAYFPIPARYGLSLVPILTVIVGAALRARLATAIVGALVAVYFLWLLAMLSS